MRCPGSFGGGLYLSYIMWAGSGTCGTGGGNRESLIHTRGVVSEVSDGTIRQGVGGTHQARE